MFRKFFLDPQVSKELFQIYQPCEIDKNGKKQNFEKNDTDLTYARTYELNKDPSSKILLKTKTAGFCRCQFLYFIVEENSQIVTQKSPKFEVS